MITSYACEQQGFLDSPGVSRRSRPEWANLPESDAIRRAQCGDAGAFERIYHLHCRRVYALCLRMAGNPTEAEDLTQEAFLTVLRKIRTFRGESAFSTWLHRITVNLVLMRFRRKTPLKSSPEKSVEPDGDSGGLPEKFSRPDFQLAGSIDRVNATNWSWSSMTFRATSTKKSQKSWIGRLEIRKPSFTERARDFVNCCRKVSPWDGERRAANPGEARAKDICLLDSHE